MLLVLLRMTVRPKSKQTNWMTCTVRKHLQNYFKRNNQSLSLCCGWFNNGRNRANFFVFFAIVSLLCCSTWSGKVFYWSSFCAAYSRWFSLKLVKMKFLVKMNFLFALGSRDYKKQKSTQDGGQKNRLQSACHGNESLRYDICGKAHFRRHSLVTQLT